MFRSHRNVHISSGVASTFLGVRPSQPTKKINAPSVQQLASSDQPILAFCELANNTDPYSGKLVRVSVTLSGFIHGLVLYDPNCSADVLALVKSQT